MIIFFARYKALNRDFLVVQWSLHPLQRAWIGFLVGELRTHLPRSEHPTPTKALN